STSTREEAEREPVPLQGERGGATGRKPRSSQGDGGAQRVALGPGAQHQVVRRPGRLIGRLVARFRLGGLTGAGSGILGGLLGRRGVGLLRGGGSRVGRGCGGGRGGGRRRFSGGSRGGGRLAGCRS